MSASEPSSSSEGEIAVVVEYESSDEEVEASASAGAEAEAGSDDDIVLPEALTSLESRKRDPDTEAAAEEAEQPPAKKARTEEEEVEAAPEAQPEPEAQAVELEIVTHLKNGKVENDSSYGVGKRNMISFEGRTHVTLPPMVVGRGSRGSGPALSGVGIITDSKTGKREFVLPLVSTLKTPDFVKDVYPAMGEEQVQLAELICSNTFKSDIFRRKWDGSFFADSREPFLKAAAADFDAANPHYGKSHVLLDEDTIVAMLVETGKYSEDVATARVRASGVTNNTAAKKNDDQDALKEIIALTASKSKKLRKEIINDKAFKAWLPDKIFNFGNMHFNGTQEVMNIELKQGALCENKFDKDEPVKVTKDMDPIVAAFVREHGLDGSKRRMKPPCFTTATGAPLINPETGNPYHEDMEPGPEMKSHMLHYEVLAVGDVVQVSGSIGLVQTPTVNTIKFFPDFTRIKILRRPKNVDMIAEAIGEKSATISFGADPFNY